MDIRETLDRVTEFIRADDLDSADAALDDLEGVPLPSTERGRGFAMRVVILELDELISEAETLIAETMTEEGDDLAFVSAAGMQFADLDAFGHAEVFLENLVQLEPENPIPPFNLAIALGRQARFPECIEWYDEAIRRDPNFAAAYAQKGFCLMQLGNAPDAALAYRRCLELDPEDAQTWMELARLEEAGGNLENAYSAYEAAGTHGGDPRLPFYECVRLALRHGDTARVEDYCSRLRDLDAGGWRTLLAEAARREMLDETANAWDRLREAVEASFDAEDREGGGAALGAVFHFASRHDVSDEIGDYVSRAFDEDLLSQPVLEGLQLLEGRESKSASGFQVVLRTVLPVLNEDDDGISQYRIYGVTADTSDRAVTIAKDFEKRCTGEGWELDSVQQISEPAPGHMGVYWQSEVVDRPPNRLAAEASDSDDEEPL